MLKQVVIFIPPTVSPVCVSLAGSGCVEAVRFADGGAFRCRLRFQWKGRFSLTFLMSASETRHAWPSLRLRLLFLHWSKWRAPCLRRRIFPVPVTLKRLATAFRVFAFPETLGMGREN